MGIEPLSQCQHWITSPTHNPSDTAPDIVNLNFLLPPQQKAPPPIPSKSSTPSPDSGRTVNPDGLIYTSVDFAGVEPSGKPVANDTDGVVYTSVDFTKTA